MQNVSILQTNPKNAKGLRYHPTSISFSAKREWGYEGRIRLAAPVGYFILRILTYSSPSFTH